MENLDRILDDFTDPATGSLHGAVFIAVEESGMFLRAPVPGIPVLTCGKEILYTKKPLGGKILIPLAQSPYK